MICQNVIPTILPRAIFPYIMPAITHEMKALLASGTFPTFSPHLTLSKRRTGFVQWKSSHAPWNDSCCWVWILCQWVLHSMCSTKWHLQLKLSNTEPDPQQPNDKATGSQSLTLEVSLLSRQALLLLTLWHSSTLGCLGVTTLNTFKHT